MNVTCPAAVSIPCSSSSPCNFVARQSRSANAGPLYSPLPRSSSGGCALSFSTTNFNSRFFQLSYRPRKHNNSSSSSKKVRARISTFYPDEERDGAGSQPAGSEQKNPGREREEPASRTRDPWSADSKARVPWTPQKQQDRVPWTAEKKQTRDFGSSANHHCVHSGSSPSQYKDSYSLNNQQQAFPASQTLLTSSDYSRKQQTRVIDSSNASRLQNRLPAFKQAAEPDAFGASFFSVGGADAFSSFTPSNMEKTQGHSPEEGRPRDGSVFTSKLEEILNKFRARESGFKQNSFRDDPYEEKRRNVAAPSALQSDRAADDGFQATRRDANRSQVYDAWKPSRKDIPHPRNRGSVNETSVEEENFNEKNSSSAASAEGRQRGPREDRRLAMGKRNAGGRHITESASVNLSASFRPKPWEGDGGSSPASKVQSPVRNGSSHQAGTCANRSGPSQSWVSGNNPKSLYLELEDGHRSNGGKKLGERGKGTKSLSMSEEDQTLHTQKSVVCKFDLTESDAEDNEDIVSSITSDAEDDGATPSLSEISDQPPSGSYMGVKTESPMPIRKGQIASWHNHSRPDLPFEFQYSYSETPVARVLGYREEPYSPFGPETMGRPWTGGPPLKKSKKNLPVFDSFNPPPKGKKGIKFVQDPGPYPKGQGPKPARSREEILGEPLTGEEIVQLVDICQNENRLLNLGRDGLTHNMLDLIHSHWKRRRVVKIRCIGVPTVDMDNVCFHLEDKTGGKIVYRAGGNVYLFRGRNYNYKDRPVIPLMLWKPPAPVYPKLIKKAPGGLTKEEAYKLRQLGQKVEPLCTLGKNGVYLSLVNDVRVAFKVDELVRIDCRGLNQSDYKKIGAKLRDLVPCVLLSFDDEQILMWKGKASVSADVDNSSRMEAAEGSNFESTEPSASCGVGSAGLSMVDTKTKVLADIAMADGADDEPCSAIEDTKQQSLVVDAIGIEGWSGNASSSHVEIFNSRTAASLSVPAYDECKSLSSINDGMLASSCSSEECYASTVTGIINQISSTELAKNDACLKESREHGLPARSEFDSSSQTVFAVEDDMIFESGKGSADYMPEYKQESNAALDTQLGESRQSLESNSMEENKEDKVTRQAALVLEQPSAKLDNSSRDAGAGKEGTNDTHVIVRVDALWDEAIASGIAIQLDDLDTDNDVIVTKASELAKTVPVVGEYTKGLLSKLRVRKENVPRPDDDLRIHFRNLQKLKTQRKLSKRPFRLPRVDVPEKGGLPIEELARLLSIK